MLFAIVVPFMRLAKVTAHRVVAILNMHIAIFCGKELAHYFGDCNGRLVDDSVVDARLQEAKQRKDGAIITMS